MAGNNFRKLHKNHFIEKQINYEFLNDKTHTFSLFRKKTENFD